MTQLSDYLGFETFGKTSWISRTKGSIKNREGYDPFDGLEFTPGTETQGGNYSRTVVNELRNKNWIMRCNNARARIKEKFSIKQMINSYNIIWSQVHKKN